MWNTKDIIMYARSHAYTPCCSYSIFANNPSRLPLLTNYQQPPNQAKTIKLPEAEVSVNVVDSDNGT